MQKGAGGNGSPQIVVIMNVDMLNVVNVKINVLIVSISHTVGANWPRGAKFLVGFIIAIARPKGYRASLFGYDPAVRIVLEDRPSLFHEMYDVRMRFL